MRRVDRREDLPAAIVAAAREARLAFGDGAVYLERLVEGGRHVEVQLLGDAHGAVVALGERDCSTQRRHQKLVEEAPAPGLTEAQRRRLHDLAVRIAGTVGLRNAATAEFLYAPDGEFYFLEVNARLQVEHGVTELVTGLDLVREQLLIAGRRAAVGRGPGGRRRARRRRRATPSSCAISAEDPSLEFAPVPGTITRWREPGGPGVRMDSGVVEGWHVGGDYDPLLAKLLVHAPDRDAAIARARRAVAELETGGVQTTLPFHAWLLGVPAFAEARLRTDLVEREWRPDELRRAAAERAIDAVARALAGGSRSPVPRRRRLDAATPRGRTEHRAGARPGAPRGRSRVAAARRSDGHDPGRFASRSMVSEPVVRDVAPDALAGSDHGLDVRPLAARRGDAEAGIVRAEVTIDGWVLRVAATSAERADLIARAGQGAGRHGPAGSEVVRARIPGRVVRLWVAEGDTVEAGARLLAIEAMKMENEVRAPRAGMVTGDPRGGRAGGRARGRAPDGDLRMSDTDPGRQRWRESTLASAKARGPERRDRFLTTSGIEVADLYTPADTAGLDEDAALGRPGEFPFTRGVQPTMYRGRLWTMRQYAGFSTAADTNARFRYLLEQGQTGLSVAFDLPTQMGYDSDAPAGRWRGRPGRRARSPRSRTWRPSSTACRSARSRRR